MGTRRALEMESTLTKRGLAEETACAKALKQEGTVLMLQEGGWCPWSMMEDKGQRQQRMMAGTRAWGLGRIVTFSFM